jgi:hypothetical protein
MLNSRSLLLPLRRKFCYGRADSSAQFTGSNDVTTNPAGLFTIPASGAGIVTPQGLDFFTNVFGSPVMGCTDIKCGTSTAQLPICVELVPVGSSPSACVARSTDALAKNPVNFFARSFDGQTSGYIKGGATGMILTVSHKLIPLTPACF